MNTRLLSLFSIMIITLSGCVPPAPKADVDAAMMTYVACLHSAAKQVDDGKSDAISVAVAIQPMCAQEFRQSVLLYGQGMSMRARLIYEQGMDGKQLEFATGAVLDERSIPKNQPYVADDPLTAGLKAANSGDGATAVKLLLPLAKHGNIYAQSSLGMIYEGGEGVKENDVEAVKWFRKAAENGEVNAQFALGIKYEIGKGIKQDYVQAYKWLNISIEHIEDFPKSANRNGIIKTRNDLASLMTPEQIAEAQRLTREWKPMMQNQ